jgi:hypothetical protein
MKSKLVEVTTVLLLLLLCMQKPGLAQERDTVHVEKAYYSSLAGKPIMESFGKTSAASADCGRRVNSAYRLKDIEQMLALISVLHQSEWYSQTKSEFITAEELLKVVDKMIEYRVKITEGSDISSCIEQSSFESDKLSEKKAFWNFIRCLDGSLSFFSVEDMKEDHARYEGIISEHYELIKGMHGLIKDFNRMRGAVGGVVWENYSYVWSETRLEAELDFIESVWNEYVYLIADDGGDEYGFSGDSNANVSSEDKATVSLQLTNGTSGLLYVYVNDQKKELNIRPECETVYAETVAFDKLSKLICGKEDSFHAWVIKE